MKTTTIDIKSLVDRIGREEILLPEIQREYVWKPTQVAYLIDSLYRKYPSGSLLLWETGAPVTTRSVAIVDDGKPLTKPQYLLDGQQRLTSLHRVFTGHENAQIVFNVETEKFQNQSAATLKDPRWVLVHGLLDGTQDLYTLVEELSAVVPELARGTVHERLHRVKKIGDYTYFIEILDDLSYEEVTEIFIRVNSRGRRLTTVDLAIATLTARKAGVLKRFVTLESELATMGYGDINVGTLTRALAMLGTDSGTFRGFSSASDEQIEAGWQMVRKGALHLVPLLKNNARLATSSLLPSITALLPLIAYLGRRTDAPLLEEEGRGLVYWLFAALLMNRYSGSTDTVLAQDLAAVTSAEPLRALFKNLGVVDRLIVTQDQLAGRGVGGAHFMLSYLAAERAGAKDWWYGVNICTDARNSFALQYHHIHPQARLKAYAKSERNDLANYAFISAKANLKISDRRPADYFPEVGDDQLKAHFVPLDDSLRTPDAYRDFIRARRRLLADGMTSLLDSYRPEWLGDHATPVADPLVGERVVLTLFADGADDCDGLMVVDAARDGIAWQSTVRLDSLSRAIDEMAMGIGTEVVVDGGAIAVQPSDNVYEIPVGPFVLQGTADEWAMVLTREVDTRFARDNAPSNLGSDAWEGERRAFPVAATE